MGYIGVDGQVEEVEFLNFLIFGEKFDEHLLRVLDGNVSDHDGAPSIELYSFDIDFVVLVFF